VYPGVPRLPTLVPSVCPGAHHHLPAHLPHPAAAACHVPWVDTVLISVLTFRVQTGWSVLDWSILSIVFIRKYQFK